MIFYQKKWWLFIMRGLVAILFGLLAIIWPELTVTTLVILFGGFVLVDGLFALISGLVTADANPRWWSLIIGGFLAIGIGIATILWPEITGVVLVYFIAAWALITGIFNFVAALHMRQTISGEWLMLLSGILSVIFGLFLFLFPREGAASLVIVIGVFAIVLGVMNFILGFRLRKARD